MCYNDLSNFLDSMRYCNIVGRLGDLGAIA